MADLFSIRSLDNCLGDTPSVISRVSIPCYGSTLFEVSAAPLVSVLKDDHDSEILALLIYCARPSPGLSAGRISINGHSH